MIDSRTVHAVGILTYKDYKYSNRTPFWMTTAIFTLIIYCLLRLLLGMLYSGQFTSELFVTLTISIIFFATLTGIEKKTFLINYPEENKVSFYLNKNEIIQEKFNEKKFIKQNEIKNIKESRKYFLFILETNARFVIPKTFFKTNEDIELFKDLLKLD